MNSPHSEYNYHSKRFESSMNYGKKCSTGNAAKMANGGVVGAALRPNVHLGAGPAAASSPMRGIGPNIGRGGRRMQAFADGGEVGLFERLRAGNIDDPSSEAYRRWGAGSKATPAPAPSEAPAEAPAPAPEAPADAQPQADIPTAGFEDLPSPQSDSSDPEPKKVAPSTPKRKPAARRKSSNYSNEGRGSKPTASSGPAAASTTKKGFYANAAANDPVTFKSMGEGLKRIFGGRPTVSTDETDAYVNGGLIGKVHTVSPYSAGQTVTTEELSNPTENVLGGGRKSYGKK